MKIITVVGARPQFIKLAPLSRLIEQEPDVQQVLVHSGQHFDREMSDYFFEQLGLPEPDYHLGIKGISHGAMVGRMTEALEKILNKEQPDWVLVFGDTNTTLAGALASSKLNFPVAHVEAGVRSFKRKMPEEINRVLTDHSSTLLFCPTINAVHHLAKEGFSNIFRDGQRATSINILDSKQLNASPDQPLVINVGDIMYDSFCAIKNDISSAAQLLDKLKVVSGQFALATVHRVENTEEIVNLKSIMTGLKELSRSLPVILPLHPRTRKILCGQNWWSAIQSDKRLLIIEPTSYLDFIHLERHAKIILTDSGGAQREAYFVGTPCLILRDETEWPETVESGWARLVGTEGAAIADAALNFELPSLPKPSLFGEGYSSRLILDFLRYSS
jgi:UDP-GlcNAc3NAcA epimerase